MKRANFIVRLGVIITYYLGTFFLGLNFVSWLNIIKIGLNISYFYCTKSICGLAHVQKNI